MFDAYVLHTICYRETSLIIKFFTKEQGITNLIANGAKRKKSQFAGILQPFLPLLIYWKDNSKDLATLYKAEALTAPHKLPGVFLFSSLYINELLLKLLSHHDPAPELFLCYKQFLENLSNLSKNNNALTKLELAKNLRFIEKKILQAIGYELQLDRESRNGQAIDINAKYYFDFDNGLNLFQLSTSQKPCWLPKPIIITGKSLLALHNNDYIDLIEMQEAKIFMRRILANFLGDRVLATRKLFV